MDPTEGSTVLIYQQQPTMIMQQAYQRIRSCPLIGMGVTLLILSLATLGIGVWATKFQLSEDHAYTSLGCSGFFCLISLFSIYGGNDVSNRKCSIITVSVLGIFGLIAGVVGIFTSIRACRICNDIEELTFENLFVFCSPDTCFDPYYPGYFGIVIITFIQAIVGLLLSFCACCNACSCCCCDNTTNSGTVVQQSAPMTISAHNLRHPPPPQYNRLQEVDDNDIVYRQPPPYNENF